LSKKYLTKGKLCGRLLSRLMDTSETYIKMSDCPEIQDKAPRKPYTTDLYSVGEIIMTYTLYRPEESQYDAIWLPRQDQLQEMIWGGWDDIAKMHLLCDFTAEAQELYAHTGEFPSMEQLWLAFVMSEKYNKTWDGEKWANGKTN